MINLLDDFHNILTIRLPSELKLSVATHMASSLLDIHNQIPAVRLPSSTGSQHSTVKVKMSGVEKECRGGIIVNNIIKILTEYKDKRHKPFFERLPSALSINPKHIQHQLKELRYSCGILMLIFTYKKSIKDITLSEIFITCLVLHYSKTSRMYTLIGS